MPGSMSGAGAGALKLIEEIRELKSQISELKEKMAGSILWENPDPAVAFPAQTINLLSNDYDKLKIYYKDAITNNYMLSSECLKGDSTILLSVSYNSSGAATMRRDINISDQTVEIGAAGVGRDNKQLTNNNILVPVKIIGYKSQLSRKE